MLNTARRIAVAWTRPGLALDLLGTHSSLVLEPPAFTAAKCTMLSTQRWHWLVQAPLPSTRSAPSTESAARRRDVTQGVRVRGHHRRSRSSSGSGSLKLVPLSPFATASPPPATTAAPQTSPPAPPELPKNEEVAPVGCRRPCMCLSAALTHALPSLLPLTPDVSCSWRSVSAVSGQASQSTRLVDIPALEVTTLRASTLGNKLQKYCWAALHWLS